MATAASLAPVITPALLTSIRSNPHLPKHTWYIITATTLSMINRPDEIPMVYKHALDFGPEATDHPPGRDEQLRISQRTREALIKASPIGGLPKTINALHALRAVTPPHLAEDACSPSPAMRRAEVFETPSSQILQRGQDFFDAIYGKVSKRVTGDLERASEDLSAVVRLAYSYILSNTNVLTPAETSFVVMASLIPQDANFELKGHLRGALNGGATVEQVRAVREVIISICEASGMTRLPENAPGGWGWRNELWNL